MIKIRLNLGVTLQRGNERKKQGTEVGKVPEGETEENKSSL